VSASIQYGKGQVSFYRTYARPLAGLEPIPESAFAGRSNILFGAEVDVEVFGDNFLPAYTEGDNSGVVPTDTMKNFTHQVALGFGGSTLEGFLNFLGRQFLETYPQMQALRLTGREAPFVAARVPAAEEGAFADSTVLFSRSRDDRAFAQLQLVRDGAGASIAAHRCGREGMQLLKVTGSSFMHFARDGYTTLPEQADRPLFIYLDVYWRYADPADAVAEEPARYVPAEQVRDCVVVIFHQFVSRSIQHLVHEMGERLLQRFPRLAEVSFQAQNRLWDTAAVSETDPKTRVYTDPRPPYGTIGLTLTRA
jgi:urate oxidase